MTEITEKYYALEDLGELPLEDAMIIFASKRHVFVFREIEWKAFKVNYKCAESSVQLFNKFWDDIMPNLQDYEIVRNSTQISDELSYIPNPKDFPPPIPIITHFVTERSLYEHQREKQTEKQRRIFSDPQNLALKLHCENYIREIMNQERNNTQYDHLMPGSSEGGPEGRVSEGGQLLSPQHSLLQERSMNRLLQLHGHNRTIHRCTFSS